MLHLPRDQKVLELLRKLSLAGGDVDIPEDKHKLHEQRIEAGGE